MNILRTATHSAKQKMACIRWSSSRASNITNRTRRPIKAGFPLSTNLISNMLGLSALTITICWYYYPHNPYPPSVSKPLRKASWEEIKTKNYKKGIEYYYDALRECKETGINIFDERYTGIEIKIAELYEKLELNDDANKIYAMLLTRFYKEIKEGKSNLDYDNLIKRDLSILIKLNKNVVDNVALRKDLLQLHINLVQDKIFGQNPQLKSLLEPGNETIFLGNENNERDTMISKLKQHSKIFESFKEEFIVARDLYTDLCLNSNSLDQALRYKMVTIGWMVLSNMEEGTILLSQANLASMFYLNSENIEYQTFQLKQYPPSERNQKTLTNLTLKYNEVLNTASQYYQTVIRRGRMKKVTFPIGKGKDENTLQAIILSVYGLGVIKLHQGNLKEANELLEESKTLANEYQLEDISREASSELQKLQKIKTEAKTLE